MGFRLGSGFEEGSRSRPAPSLGVGVEAEDGDDEEPFAPATCVYGHDNEPTARFCVECGVPMDGEEDEQALRLGQELKEVLEDSETAKELAERLAQV